MTMSGFGRRLIGMWIAVAIVLVVALGLFRGESSGPDPQRTAQGENWAPGQRTIVVQVLGPVLY